MVVGDGVEVEVVEGFDMEGGEALGFGEFDEFDGVGGVAAADDDDGLGALLCEEEDVGLAFFGGAADGVEDEGVGVECFEVLGKGSEIVGEHGGLGDHADFVAEGGEGIDVTGILDDVAVAFGVA